MSYDAMTDRELLLHVLGELQALRSDVSEIQKRLLEGDERMTRIEANIGMAMNASAAALDASGQTGAASKFRAILDDMRQRNGAAVAAAEEKTNPGQH